MAEKIAENTAENNSKLQKTNKFLVVVIVLLSIILGLTLWQYFDLRKTAAQKGNEIELLTDERGDLENELENMLAELDTMETSNDSMKVELSNRKEEIEDLLAKVKDKDYAIYKLKKETTTLRKIMRGYVVTIDSINTLNVGLRKENKKVLNTLSKERSRSKELEKTNENLSGKVALASRLKFSGISVYGVHVKKDLTGKETDRSRKADKLRICFTVEENAVAKIGKKELFLRIIAPNGVILTEGVSEESKFEYNGGKSYFSDKLVIDYDQNAKDYCMDWAKPDEDYEMLPGEYQLFLYAEDYEVGSVSYRLK